MNRRAFVAGGLCACCYCQSQAQPHSLSGCIRYETAPGSAHGTLAGLSRLDFSQDFENGFVIVLQQLSDVLRVSASFGMYDDDVNHPNAIASWEALLPLMSGSPAPDGTVAVGRQLVKVLRGRATDFGPALTAVCAHEYGHILQFKFVFDELMKAPNSDVRAELHADFVCGYFAAFRKQVQPSYDAATQAETQYQYGDGKYTMVSHGTPDQRGDAVYAGFLLGRKGKIDPKLVATIGLDYVRTLRL